MKLSSFLRAHKLWAMSAVIGFLPGVFMFLGLIIGGDADVASQLAVGFFYFFPGVLFVTFLAAITHMFFVIFEVMALPSFIDEILFVLGVGIAFCLSGIFWMFVARLTLVTWLFAHHSKITRT